MPIRFPASKPSRPGSRLLFSVLSLSLSACGGEFESDARVASDAIFQSAPLASTARVRLMAANISSGNNQSYDPGNGTRIFQGTKPDVVMIQEFNYGDNSATVISRYPIIASGEWDDTQVSNRDFAWARIDIPGPTDLWVVSVHLLTTSSTVRNTEATNLVNFIKSKVPAGSFIAIGGDFNSDSRSEALFSTFSSVVSTASPYPADKNGNVNTNASRAKPYDHVLVSSNLRAYQTATVIGSSSFSGGLVVDTRVYSPLSEISPAQSGDSGATNMQHMAVIKDFLVPVP
jgi:endonuclease/exonuclease/phosphatase family metal-dependent hydrolase